MKNNKQILDATLAAVLLMGAGGVATTAQADHHNGAKPKKEKCYGIVKAGMNSCAHAFGEHSCAGKAKKDGSGAEWIKLPKGMCDKIVGGSTKPVKEKSDK